MKLKLKSFESQSLVSQESVKSVKDIVKLLALALTNLVLDLVNLVINLVKPSLGQPSHQPDQT